MTLVITKSQAIDGCPTFAQAYSGFPVELAGVGTLYAAFLNESRTRGCWWRPVQEIRIRGTKTMGAAQQSLSFYPRSTRATAVPVRLRSGQALRDSIRAVYLRFHDRPSILVHCSPVSVVISNLERIGRLAAKAFPAADAPETTPFCPCTSTVWLSEPTASLRFI
jgi:hypothetical protein